MTFNKNLRNKKGFTLIELLVVIAIIGILSSVVLSSLNTAREKGKDAKAKSELASVRSQADLFYDDNNQSFGDDDTNCLSSGTGNVFDPTATDNISVLVSDAETAVAGTAVCANSMSDFVVALPLINGDNWCVDSAGYSGTTTMALTGSPSVQENIACQ